MKSFEDFVKEDKCYREFKEDYEENYVVYQAVFKQYSKFTPDLTCEDWMVAFDRAMTGDFISVMIMSKLWNSLPDELNPEKDPANDIN